MPKASAPKAVRRSVAVAADNRQTGLRQSELGADHVDDALVGSAHVGQRHAKLTAVCAELLDLLAGDLVGNDAQPVGRSGDGVIHRCRHGVVGSADLETAIAQALEGLRRGHLMDEVQVDVEDRRRTRLMNDDMIVPDLFE
ncbi:MAG: hypothetical protein R2724_16335 [Bryobacterales bacterium]